MADEADGGRPMTPKQILKAHMRAHHKRQAGLPSFERASLSALVTAHKRDHHARVCDHIHGGSNTGPHDRPAGWTTGQDVLDHEAYYERAAWPVGTPIQDPDDPQRRGTLVRQCARLWVDRDRRPPLVRWHGTINAVPVPWYRLFRLTG